MGNIVGGIVGGLLNKSSGKKQEQQIRKSGEQGRAIIEQGTGQAVTALQPFAQSGATANDAILGALGQGDPGAQQQQFQNFLNSTGFQSQLRAGSQAITGNNAAAGLLNSGATLQGINTFGQDLAQQGFNNFLGNLGNVAQRGFGATSQQANITAQGAQGQADALIGTGVQAADARNRGEQGFQSGIGQAVQGVFNALPRIG